MLRQAVEMEAEQSHQCSMLEYLLEFQIAGQTMNFIVLIAYIVIIRKITAFVVTLAAVCLLGFAHMHWQLYVESLYLNPDYKSVLGELWYFGFSITNFIFASLALQLCNYAGLVRDRSCNLILYSYLMLGFIQCARYFDRYIVETNFLSGIYKLSIPSINLMVSTLVVFYFLHSIKAPIIKLAIQVSKKTKAGESL